MTEKYGSPGPRHERDRGGNRERSERSERPERTQSPERAERTERTDRPERDRPERERPQPSIADLLKEGQEIIVQIAKEPLGQKGARITSHIALPGRFVVYMPTVDHAGVSRKIPSDEERQRLKKIVQTHRQGIPGGFICRTAAENKSEEELKSDMQFLYNLWLDMRAKAEKKPAPVLLHHDLDLVQRILRDQLTSSFKNIWVDGEELYESVLRFAQRFQPALVGRVKLYTRNNPIFDEFGITNELEKALRPKVWLKSGGYIVINQTEALVAIDVNTGKYVGKSNRLEDTIVRVNTDAIKEIVRQIRLRDLGGIIVVDFIDMDERRNRRSKVTQSLEVTPYTSGSGSPYKILIVQRFLSGGDYPKTREAVPGTDPLRALPVLRGSRLCEEPSDRHRRDPPGGAAHAQGSRERAYESRAARESRGWPRAQEQSQSVFAGDRRDSGQERPREERPAVTPDEVRPRIMLRDGLPAHRLARCS